MLRSKRDLKLLSTQIQHEPNLVGTWVNELGSKMRIDSVDDGLITGKYWSKVSAEKEPVCGDLTGMVAGDTIGFAVNWRPTFDSITSWSGKLLTTDQGYPYIFTLWHLSHDVGDASDWWQSFLAGSDTFWLEQDATVDQQPISATG
jgi:hypothetical protein